MVADKCNYQPKLTSRTYFAPATRASSDEIDRVVGLITKSDLVRVFLSTVEGYYLVLNSQRQVIAANEQLLSLLGVNDPSIVIGKRPGEALGCVHATEGPGGCGTSMACRECGAVVAILASQHEMKPVVKECLATVCRDSCIESLEFRIRATPVTIDDNQFTALAFTDISSEKRQKTLERIYFHDIMNSVGGIMGYASLLAELDKSHQDEYGRGQIAGKIMTISKELVHFIQDHQKLIRAENQTLKIRATQIKPFHVLEDLRTNIEAHAVAHERRLEIVTAPKDYCILTDKALLLRVLINMVKNALEAIEKGDTVSVGFELHQGSPAFWVHNPGRIPDDIANQIFKRAFSTKGSGRGIGTYSMKLFGERYLGGQVGFETSKGKGTTFWIRLPANGHIYSEDYQIQSSPAI